MRTISIRLDERTDALLTRYCQLNHLTQTSAVKTAIEKLTKAQRETPAALASRLGLIGGFASTEGDLAENHSQRVKERLRKKSRDQSAPATPASSSGGHDD